MLQKLKSDKELKENYEAVRLAVQDCLSQENPRSIGNFFRGTLHFRGGFHFHENESLTKAKKDLIHRCIKHLGHKFDHEGELEAIMWDSILKDVTNDQSFSDFIEALVELYGNSFHYIMPNYLFRFSEGVKKITIGPVEALYANKIIPDLKKVTNADSIVFKEADKTYLELKASMPLVQNIKSLSWRVSLNASKNNLEEEALWLINIAVSLFRLSYKNHVKDFFPRPGENEPLPNVGKTIEKTGFSANQKAAQVFIGGGEVPPSYTIDKKALGFTKRKKFIGLTNAIFAPKKGTLAERVSQGLGWLTKGRQANDKSEKFLFFFTAIEALLSSSDKSAPVVQTISRNAASILAKDVQGREQIAYELKKLYGARSALVHAGKRGVPKKDVILIQLYAETLFWVILEKMDLNIKLETFQQGLNKASYGNKWPC